MIIGSAVVPMQIIMLLLMLTSERQGLAKAIAFVLGMTLVRLGQGILFGLIFARGKNLYVAWLAHLLADVAGIALLSLV